MFVDCEKWRVEFGVEQVKRTFHFDEREKANQYYPQYYHKTDKVSPPYSSNFIFFDVDFVSLVDRYILNNWIQLIFLQCIKSQLRKDYCKI